MIFIGRKATVAADLPRPSGRLAIALLCRPLPIVRLAATIPDSLYFV